MERVVSPRDRRSAHIRLTERGRALTGQLLAPHIDNETWVLSVLDPDERRALEKLALKLVRHLESGEAPR